MVMIEVIFHVFVVIQFPVDVAFPYFHDVVALTSQVLDLFHGRIMEFLRGFTIDRVHDIASVTFWASVPETAVDFVGRVRFLVVTVEQIETNTFLTTVTCVLDISFVLFGRVREPFMGKQRLFVLGAISQRWNDYYRIFWEVVSAIHEMTGRRNSECCKRIDICDVIKQFAKF